MTTDTQTALKTPWTDTSPHPWRRFFARFIDTPFSIAVVLLFLLTIKIIIEIITGPLAYNPMGYAFLVSLYIAPIIINGICIGLFGTSLGKWLFGIQVHNNNGTRLGFWRAVQRELWVLICGKGLYIPLISLIIMIYWLCALPENKETLWDKRMNLIITHRPNSTAHIMLSSIGILIILVLVFYSLP